jgi:Ca2+-binding EF-hand superfamily protein
MPKHPVSTILGLISILALPVIVLPTTSAFAAKALTAADTDKDGTLDKAEVDAAAGAEFDKLDKDKDGTLTKAEVGTRLSKADFAAADTDNDKTLTKDEYVAAADADFKAADADGDGTVDAKELKSKAGRTLTRLIS